MSVALIKRNIKDKYLKPDGADFWFVFGDERVPGHKFVLEMSPKLNNTFTGSLPIEHEVDMSKYDITFEAFKEFLRFFYMGQVNLTMDNIEEIINLAKLWLVNRLLVECENFLIKSLTTENMFFGYRLAVSYEANRLKNHCEKEIGLHPEKVPTFLDFSYDCLEKILKCDTLTCNEKHIFDACIAWAKAACERKGYPLVPENIRAQLKDAKYQIRFNSMTREEGADCISSFRRLFTNEELEEIICMIGRKTEFQTKKFNWTARKHRIQRKNQRELECSFVNYFMEPEESDFYWMEFMEANPYWKWLSVEQTTFTSNKMLMLNGFTCEGIEYEQDQHKWIPAIMMRYLVDVRIFKIHLNDNNKKSSSILFNQQMVLNFTERRGLYQKAHVKLEPAILIRPQSKYKIEIEFPSEPHICNYWISKESVRVDHNIVIRFDGTRRGISSLNISRIDEENYFKKCFQNPKVYFMMFGMFGCFSIYWVFRD